eukprot:jgi/Orpsp1_1/1180372/evm.model.c7180000073122.1
MVEKDIEKGIVNDNEKGIEKGNEKIVEKGNVEHLVKSEGKKVSPKRRTAIFLNLNISCIATSMLATALTTALPAIMEDLDISVNTAQWLTSGFALFIAVITPFTAYLITRFKTKKLYCTALSLFIIGLTICAISKNFWLMMLGRIIQGSGNGLIGSIGQVIIITIYPKEKIGTMMGWYGLSIGVAPIIAPTIAGILVDTVGWRMIFVIAIVIMVISLIYAIIVFEDVLPTMSKKFDVISLILSALAFGGITLSIGNLGTYDIMTWQVGFAFIVGAISFIIFVWRQLSIEVPFLDVRVLKYWDYTVSLLSTVLIQLTFLGTSVIFPVYVQQIKGGSATISGLVTLPGSLIWAIVSPVAGKFYDRFGMKMLYLIAGPILILSNFGIYFINIHHSVWVLSAINVFRFLACGSLIMPLVTWAMKDIPKLKASDATAFYNSVRFVAGAVATALFITIMTKVAKANPQKENPEMYGVNIVFLIMTFISILLFLLGMFGCKGKIFKNKDKKNTKRRNSIEKLKNR